VRKLNEKLLRVHEKIDEASGGRHGAPVECNRRDAMNYRYLKLAASHIDG
jgi:hypothetical protein